MLLTKKIFNSLIISIVFVAIHFLIDRSQPSDAVMGIVSIGGMMVAQLAAYFILKRNQSQLSFGSIMGMLCMAQWFIIILLSLNSAYNPYADPKPLNLAEIGMSLAIFGIVMPLVVTTILWFAGAKKTTKLH